MSKICPECGFENYIKTRYCNLCSEKLYTVYCSRCGTPKTHLIQTICSTCDESFTYNEEMLISSFHTRILFKAIKQGDYAKVEECLFCNADVDAYNYKGEAPLHCAMVVGMRNIVELLLSAGADVNAVERRKGATPLHLAETKEMAELLLLWGATISLKDYNSRTPLQWAIETGKYHIADLIKMSRPHEVECAESEDYYRQGIVSVNEHSLDSPERVKHLEMGLKKAYSLIEKRETRISELLRELEDAKKARQEIRCELVRVKTRLEKELSASWWVKLMSFYERSFRRAG